jgi:asparagine synthase (glutamine-hydrolysing)
MSFDFKMKRTLTGLSYPEELWNPVWLGPIEPAEIADVFNEPMDVEDVFSEALALWRTSSSTQLLDKTLEFYTNLYLPDNILTKVDRASMMVSLEVRAPFLDNNVVEFARRLPGQFKYHNGTRKRLLKKAMRGILPERILSRRKKGFGIPVSEWLQEFPSNPPLRPVPNVQADWVANRWRDHRRGRADHRLFLWSWLSMQCLPENAWLSQAPA